MGATATVHRQTVTLSATAARRARALARERGISTSRLLGRLVEEGLESEQRRRERFLALAKDYRAATDSAEADRLGDELGRMVFGG
ncbi:MAG: hypothetical protein ACRD01_09355 [Terriglobales bacterium]